MSGIKINSEKKIAKVCPEIKNYDFSNVSQEIKDHIIDAINNYLNIYWSEEKENDEFIEMLREIKYESIENKDIINIDNCFWFIFHSVIKYMKNF